VQRQLGITSVYVTHDQEEALAISDRVIVMNVAVIEQIGTPEEIYNQPRNRFVADFVGSANLIKGRVRQSPANPGSLPFVAEGGHVLEATAAHALRGNETEVAVRPAYIGIGKSNAVNQLPGTVRRRMFHGDFVQYVVDCPLGQIIVRRPPTNLVAEGEEIELSFLPEHCVLLEG
jgi:ABC-type Fe3+/spermidine/putrescine transport system ATPase subunit